MSARSPDILIQDFYGSPKILSSTAIQRHNKLIVFHSGDSGLNLHHVNYNLAKHYCEICGSLLTSTYLSIVYNLFRCYKHSVNLTAPLINNHSSRPYRRKIYRVKTSQDRSDILVISLFISTVLCKTIQLYTSSVRAAKLSYNIVYCR